MVCFSSSSSAVWHVSMSCSFPCRYTYTFTAEVTFRLSFHFTLTVCPCLQAVVIQQDSFIEDQRQALSSQLSTTSSRQSISSSSSCSSLSSSTSSRPSSLIEQEKHRSLERQRQEVASLQVSSHYCCFHMLSHGCSELIVPLFDRIHVFIQLPEPSSCDITLVVCFRNSRLHIRKKRGNERESGSWKRELWQIGRRGWGRKRSRRGGNVGSWQKRCRCYRGAKKSTRETWSGWGRRRGGWRETRRLWGETIRRWTQIESRSEVMYDEGAASLMHSSTRVSSQAGCCVAVVSVHVHLIITNESINYMSCTL